MKTAIPSVVIGLVLLGAVPLFAAAPVAGEAIGLTAEETRFVAVGVSAKKQLLGSSVYNDKDENIGTIEDVIVTPKGEVSVEPSLVLVAFSGWGLTTSPFRFANSSSLTPRSSPYLARAKRR